jgi:hypothetical protein
MRSRHAGLKVSIPVLREDIEKNLNPLERFDGPAKGGGRGEDTQSGRPQMIQNVVL